MVASNHISPGMVLNVGGKLYRVESAVKVTVRKGAPFMKVKLWDLKANKSLEKNFKLNDQVETVSLSERPLEYLYPEGKGHLFLDIETLDQVHVPNEVMGDFIHFLKEGTEVKGSFYGDSIFSIELPQFLELMVSEAEETDSDDIQIASATKTAVLETGAKVEVPPFVEIGDIIKVDTHTNEYIQRV